MRRASVYDERKGRYRYYRLLTPPGPPGRQRNSPIGTPIQDALPELPLGAVPNGTGDQAQGVVLRVSSTRRALKLFLVAGAAYLGYRVWVNR